ncbi:hypothetical protein GCK72_023104 [Caenorhabditis remanei]|uniref:Uncharacterized protein n=1 Tax=Caenorhabditis remanei TaxID=31234 RepID=A0A6A5FVR0_CAERE|nr:hypothetical protein GCK72_023104 [Caenorhabditis remanei]KAF1746647.1 hypothetical protein GCK72_023104 [Caenorhabditis remanei]
MNSYFEANRLIEELSLTVPTERWLQIVKMIENRDLDGLNQLRNSIKKASSTTLSLDPDASNSKKEFQGTRGTPFSTASTTMIEKTKEGRHQITSDVEQTSIINFSTTPLFFKVVAMTIIITFIIVLLILFVLAFKFMSSYPAVRRDVKPTLVGSIKVATVDLKNPRILADREFTTLIFHSVCALLKRDQKYQSVYWLINEFYFSIKCLYNKNNFLVAVKPVFDKLLC